jgi:hypothetical protein
MSNHNQRQQRNNLYSGDRGGRGRRGTHSRQDLSTAGRGGSNDYYNRQNQQPPFNESGDWPNRGRDDGRGRGRINDRNPSRQDPTTTSNTRNGRVDSHERPAYNYYGPSPDTIIASKRDGGHSGNSGNSGRDYIPDKLVPSAASGQGLPQLEASSAENGNGSGTFDEESPGPDEPKQNPPEGGIAICFTEEFVESGAEKLGFDYDSSIEDLLLEMLAAEVPPDTYFSKQLWKGTETDTVELQNALKVVPSRDVIFRMSFFMDQMHVIVKICSKDRKIQIHVTPGSRRNFNTNPQVRKFCTPLLIDCGSPLIDDDGNLTVNCSPSDSMHFNLWEILTVNSSSPQPTQKETNLKIMEKLLMHVRSKLEQGSASASVSVTVNLQQVAKALEYAADNTTKCKVDRLKCKECKGLASFADGNWWFLDCKCRQRHHSKCYPPEDPIICPACSGQAEYIFVGFQNIKCHGWELASPVGRSLSEIVKTALESNNSSETARTSLVGQNRSIAGTENSRNQAETQEAALMSELDKGNAEAGITTMEQEEGTMEIADTEQGNMGLESEKDSSSGTLGLGEAGTTPMEHEEVRRLREEIVQVKKSYEDLEQRHLNELAQVKQSVTLIQEELRKLKEEKEQGKKSFIDSEKRHQDEMDEVKHNVNLIQEELRKQKEQQVPSITSKKRPMEEDYTVFLTHMVEWRKNAKLVGTESDLVSQFGGRVEGSLTDGGPYANCAGSLGESARKYQYLFGSKNKNIPGLNYYRDKVEAKLKTPRAFLMKTRDDCEEEPYIFLIGILLIDLYDQASIHHVQSLINLAQVSLKQNSLFHLCPKSLNSHLFCFSSISLMEKIACSPAI